MIKLNIEVDPSNQQELLEASDMLENLASHLDNEPEFLGNLAGKDIFSNTEITLEELNQLPNDVKEKHTGRVVTSEVKKSVDSATEQDISTEIQTSDDASSSVKLANGIPWDARIHSGNKSILAKAPNGWKLKRGVDPALVAEVETELRAAMSASPEKPIETATATNTDGPTPPAGGPTPPATEKPAPTPAAPVKYIVEGIAYTADELKGFNSGWNDENIADLPIDDSKPAAIAETTTTALTWPQMLAKITAAKADGTITDADVTAACNANGLASIQLVGARPDLQPLIMTALFG